MAHLVAVLTLLALFLTAPAAQAARPFRPRGEAESNIAGTRSRFENLARGEDDDTCRRHLRGYGWDRTAQEHCPQAGIFLRSDGTVSHTYRGERGDDRNLEDINEILRARRDWRERQSEKEYERVQKPATTATAPEEADASEVWENHTGCKMFVRETGDKEWAIVPPGRRIHLNNGNEAELYAECSACTLTSTKTQPGTYAIGCNKGDK